MIAEGETPAFERGRSITVARGEQEYAVAIERATLVILVGGEGGTLEVAERALAAGRIVLPLADTGGDARDFHRRLSEAPPSSFRPPPDVEELAMLAGEAPSVVDDLARIIKRLVEPGPEP